MMLTVNYYVLIFNHQMFTFTNVERNNVFLDYAIKCNHIYEIEVERRKLKSYLKLGTLVPILLYQAF